MINKKNNGIDDRYAIGFSCQHKRQPYSTLTGVSLFLCVAFMILLSGCIEEESATEDTFDDTVTLYLEPVDGTETTDKPSKSDKQAINKVLKSAELLLQSANSLAHVGKSHLRFPIKKALRPNVSQQFLGATDVEQRLIGALPEIEYETAHLSDAVKQINEIKWTPKSGLNIAIIMKIQALLNWHHYSVGAVDGNFSGNTIKALQAFQKARGLKPTTTMNLITWHFLTLEKTLMKRPVLVNYKLTKADTTLVSNPKLSQYTTVKEKVAEKFHMSRAMLDKLNPNTALEAENVITVYNPGQPNTVLVDRVEVYKAQNLLVAYDENDTVVATYPTTVGSNSPSGEYQMASRVLKPYYNKDFNKKSDTLPPGPNNPVGLVWLGLSKPSFGIHGSPMPEKISNQKSGGCVRLTNWDALSLYGTLKKGAKVSFKAS